MYNHVYIWNWTKTKIMKKLLSIILSAFMLILFADLAVAQQPVIKFKFGKIKVNVKKDTLFKISH